MKPIIIYVEDKDKVTFSREELERIVKDAYDQGYRDGRDQCYWISTSPSIVPTQGTGTAPLRYDQITC